MKKLMYIFLILPLIMSGCKGKKETERGGMPTPEISVAYPLVQNITLTKDYPGYLTTEQTVNLVARVNGALQSASFTPGTRVKQGQLLFVIEPTIYKDNVTQAEAQLKTALAQLEYARNNYSRMKEALKSDAVSRIQVLQAESNVAEATAAVSNAEATLNTAHTNLGYCYIRAPFNGTVSRSLYDVGSYVVHLQVKDGTISFQDSQCPDHVCEQFGQLSEEGAWAACVPAGVYVKLAPLSEAEAAS